ncbi:MAG TPA: hypothetical protein VG816_14415 [Solirubrobacterales bacterium]|nr:hypothetical protein [Solirubrobacterales bacterium]
MTLYWALTAMAAIESDSRSVPRRARAWPGEKRSRPIAPASHDYIEYGEAVSVLGRGRAKFACAISIVALGIAIEVAAPATSVASPLVPPGFRLKASNGYSLRVLASRNPHTGRGDIVIFASTHAAAVFYAAPAEVTETSIDADLGRVGRISVDFVPSGAIKKERSQCGKPVEVQAGNYVGTIDFEGEEGFSEAHATSVPGEAKFILSLVCGGSLSEGTGGHSPGARLTAHGPKGKFEFEARKNSPSRPARFRATIEERRGSMTIERGVGAEAGPSAFDYDVPGGTATVSPPAPFDGEATFRRDARKSMNWHGDLSVDFPGRADVALTGSGTHASLIRAVQNPSHPFRLP